MTEQLLLQGNVLLVGCRHRMQNLRLFAQVPLHTE